MTSNYTKENFINTYSKKDSVCIYDICLHTDTLPFISVTIFAWHHKFWLKQWQMSVHLSTSSYETSQVHLVTLSHTSFPLISLSRCEFIPCYPRWAAFTRRPLPTPTLYTLRETDAPGNRITPRGPRIRRRGKVWVPVSVVGKGQWWWYMKPTSTRRVFPCASLSTLPRLSPSARSSHMFMRTCPLTRGSFDSWGSDFTSQHPTIPWGLPMQRYIHSELTWSSIVRSG